MLETHRSIIISTPHWYDSLFTSINLYNHIIHHYSRFTDIYTYMYTRSYVCLYFCMQCKVYVISSQCIPVQNLKVPDICLAHSIKLAVLFPCWERRGWHRWILGGTLFAGILNWRPQWRATIRSVFLTRRSLSAFPRSRFWPQIGKKDPGWGKLLGDSSRCFSPHLLHIF